MTSDGVMIPIREPGQAEVAGGCFPADVAVVSYVEGQVPLNYDVSQDIVDLMSVGVDFGGL